MTAGAPIWPVAEVVIFDCDSTLSAVEGIDELARLTGSETHVAALTKRAMDGEIALERVYDHRLDKSNPTRAQVSFIRDIYRENVIPDAPDVIAALRELGVAVFIVSGGLSEPVRDFGVWLNVPREHIFAVDMQYDQLSGQWWRYWEQPGGNNPRANYLSVDSNPLTGTGGKNLLIDRIRAGHPGRALLVGDGLSDLEASRHVDLFVGFGGAVYRKRVATESPVYIDAPYLAPLLPLALGNLADVTPWRRLFSAGVRMVEHGEVVFRDSKMQEHLLDAVERRSG
ncbi:MAG: HAD-IB family phosphatase [Anaerolineales bacterium]|jgi:phosphoserine phosphatase|nr:HAD-IB family phosphatase [Anaerolineales bacterium]